MSAEDRNQPNEIGATEGLLAVARLFGAHGLRGDVRAAWLAPEVVDPQSLLFDSNLQLRREGESDTKTIRVADVRWHGAEMLLRIEGYDDRDKADSLRGAEICLDRNELPVLPEGWFWEADLLGLEAVDKQKGPIGRAEGLEMIGGRWLLKVRSTAGAAVLIPWVKGLVHEVNLKERTIRVDLPLDFPGLE